jgi:hypothetical protein
MGDWKIAAIVSMYSDLGDRREAVALDVSILKQLGSRLALILPANARPARVLHCEFSRGIVTGTKVASHGSAYVSPWPPPQG